ncbi:MAG: hydantoinase/oxoprolinase family protein, partial [Acetobacteraceae bacterium]
AEFAAAQPVHIIESGPAAGVVGSAVLAARLNEPRVITLDMGGTTAKAGLVEDGAILRTEALEVGAGVMSGSRLLVGAGYMLKLPAIDLAEVGAGGGSICRLDAAGAPKVGPESAGADPGPVCYGIGGTEPTITDCNLVLGYLDPGGLIGGAMKLDLAAARKAVEQRLAGPMGCSVEQAAWGMLRVASASMMRAIRAVSVERGRDPRQFALLAFGGNGPLFAAWIAAELGIGHVIIPPLPGVFSAFGLLVADTEHHASRSLRTRLDTADPDRFAVVLEELTDSGASRLARDGFAPGNRAFRRATLARYLGQSSEIAVPLPDGAPATLLNGLAERFAQEHERTYGFRAPPDEPVELVGLSVIARGIPERPRLPETIAPTAVDVPRSRRVWIADAGWVAVPVLARASLTEAARNGPLIVQEYDATCLVPRGGAVALDSFGNIRMRLIPSVLAADPR